MKNFFSMLPDLGKDNTAIDNGKTAGAGMGSKSGTVLWLTGLSGSGKSTIASAIHHFFHRLGERSYILDGDVLRSGICSDLTFDAVARKENVRRTGEIAKILVDAGVIVIASLISPFQADREDVRKICQGSNFIEIYCACPLEVCEQRDVKGLYRRARSGEIMSFTGISSPYEPPVSPNLTLNSQDESVPQSLLKVIEYLSSQNILPLLDQYGRK